MPEFSGGRLYRLKDQGMYPVFPVRSGDLLGDGILQSEKPGPSRVSMPYLLSSSSAISLHAMIFFSRSHIATNTNDSHKRHIGMSWTSEPNRLCHIVIADLPQYQHFISHLTIELTRSHRVSSAVIG